ncbi:MAG: hypothetical protein HW381_2132 [Candidatus Rokubacteria bacterium]|nr:hypothetical protein [Candidatus Rokubacteria bacterium]
MAALGAVAVLNERTGILDREAIRAAIGILAGGDSERLQRALAAAATLGAPTP